LAKTHAAGVAKQERSRNPGSIDAQAFNRFSVILEAKGPSYPR
jgi:hypothetical protein